MERRMEEKIHISDSKGEAVEKDDPRDGLDAIFFFGCLICASVGVGWLTHRVLSNSFVTVLLGLATFLAGIFLRTVYWYREPMKNYRKETTGEDTDCPRDIASFWAGQAGMHILIWVMIVSGIIAILLLIIGFYGFMELVNGSNVRYIDEDEPKYIYWGATMLKLIIGFALAGLAFTCHMLLNHIHLKKAQERQLIEEPKNEK